MELKSKGPKVRWAERGGPSPKLEGPWPLPAPQTRPCLNCIDVIQCNSFECERGFSEMNIIWDERRSKLTIKYVSSLMFINQIGPPLAVRNHIDYTKSWLIYHSSAVDNRWLKVKNSKRILKMIYVNIFNGI